MIKAFYRYIWKVSARQQLVLTALAICVFILELVPLELQRRIVNAAVERREFEVIVVLCLVYLGVALVHGGLKLCLNIYRGSVSESTNKRLRMQVNAVDPEGPKRDAPPGQEGVRISIIVSEVEAVGTFVGSSFSEPVLNGGILLSVLGYMVYTQHWMALIAFLTFCPQFLFIPFLQEAINRRTRRRIETLRALSNDIVNEAAARTAVPARKTFRRRIAFVYFLNMQIFVRKFGINFLMNLLYSLSVVGILAVGGWLLLQGRTEVGTIVAFISGINRLNDPWRDLVNYFRDMTNASTKYHLLAERLRPSAVAAD